MQYFFGFILRFLERSKTSDISTVLCYIKAKNYKRGASGNGAARSAMGCPWAPAHPTQIP